MVVPSSEKNWHEFSRELLQDFSAWCRVEAELVGCKSEVRPFEGDMIEVTVRKEGTEVRQYGTVFDMEKMRYARFPIVIMTLRFRTVLDVVKGSRRMPI